ncbi:MAG: acyl-CoA dehydrogenase, partial [Pseudonocardia sp.]|nr:acyl-CoA dehydrogenase [Pseudonocardia sp.]
QQTVRLLMSVGDLLIGWLLLRHADIAQVALDDGELKPSDRAFYQGKVGAARFFATNVLPELTARRSIVEQADNALMELDEAAF